MRKISKEQLSEQIKRFKKAIHYPLCQFFECLALALTLGWCCGCFVACNVTRTITTTQTVVQRGDTTTTMSTKTIETYDASKKM